jgi:molybdate transport system permease protein
MTTLSDAEIEALLLSLRVSSVAVLAALPFALAAALLLARRNFPGKILVDAVLHMPLVLPPVAMGYLLLVVFGTRAGLGAGFTRPSASASCSTGRARCWRRRSSPFPFRCGR